MKKLFYILMVITMICNFANTKEKLLFELEFGKLGVISEEQAVDNFMMPTSIRAIDEKLIILDAPNFAIRVFTLTGELIHSVILPSKTLEGKQVLYTDLYLDPSKNFMTASPTDSSLLLLNYKGEFLKKISESPIVKEPVIKLLHTIEQSPDGNVLIQDIYEGKIHLQTKEGKIIHSFEITDKALVTHDACLISTEVKGEKSNELLIKKTSINTKKTTDLVKITFDKLCIPKQIGTDKNGNIYLHMINGATELPEESFILKLTKEGKEVYRKPIRECPNAGTIRDVCISPEGEVYFMTSLETGIGVFTLE